MNDASENIDVKSTVAGWVSSYSDHLYSWALYKTGHQETAEDLVQETFLAACQSFNKFEHKSNAKTWLFGILNNKVSNFYRKKISQPTAAELHQSEQSAAAVQNFFFDADTDGGWVETERPLPWPGEHQSLLDDPIFHKVLQTCLKRLPVQWCAAIELKYLDEKKGPDICQELGMTATNFWQILHRAKLQLRKCLDNNWFKRQ